MTKHCLILLAITFSLSAYPQEITIKGSVVLGDDEALECYHLIIKSPENDSVYITGDVFCETNFEMKTESALPLLIEISRLGYQRAHICINHIENNIIDIGKVDLEPLAENIAEITVTAKKPVIKLVDGNLQVNVENTVLSHSGSLVDVLKRLPGLIVSKTDALTVIGRGAPLIVLNGREIKNKEELEAIRSIDVESIRIDRYPSSAYSASVKSVIYIKTILRVKDMFSLQASNTLTVKRKVSDNPSLRLSLRKGIMSSIFSYSYNYAQDKIFETSSKSAFYPSYTLKNSNDGFVVTKYSGHTLLLGTDIHVNEKNLIGFQYFFRGSLSDNQAISETFITKDEDMITKEIVKHTTPHRNLHSGSVNYNYIRNENSVLRLIVDYAGISNKESSHINELNENENFLLLTDIYNQAEYDIYTGSLNYRFLLPWEVKTVLGSQFSYVDNRFSVFSESNSNQTSVMQNTWLKDQITSAFFTLNKTLNFMDVHAGIRYEYAKTKTRKSSEDINNSDHVKRSFSDFFPNISLSMTKLRNFEFNLSYARRIIRPNFRELDPSIYYEDSLSYTSGNPLLKPSYDNDFLFRVSYKNKFSFSFNYLKTNDAILQTYVEDEDRADVLKMIPVNIPESQSLNMNTMFNYEANTWNFNCDFGVNIPRLNIPTSEGIQSINKISWTCSANLDWTFAKYFTAYTNFSYSSSNYSLITYQFAYNNLTVGLLARLVDNKLTIDLSGTDILDGSNWNNWDEKYLNIVTRMRGRYDMRGLKLSISYLFNGAPRSLKSQRGNISPLQRVN